MTEENFLLVSLKDDEAKQLAQVISNDTSRRILDFLAKRKDATESDMAKHLSMPLSTTHYNLMALRKARLIQVDEFHYSEKGKEVNHYSLANKYVIIAPKGTSETLKDKLKKILPAGIIAIAGAGILQLFDFSARQTVEKAAVPRFMEAAGDQVVGAPEIIRESIVIAPQLWFLYGVIFTIIVIIAVDYVKNRK